MRRDTFESELPLNVEPPSTSLGLAYVSERGRDTAYIEAGGDVTSRAVTTCASLAPSLRRLGLLVGFEP